MKLYRVQNRWMMKTVNHVEWFDTLDALFERAKELNV